MTVVKVLRSLMLLTQVGSCECQRRVWPRMSFPFDVAQSMTLSALPQLNDPRDAKYQSVYEHFKVLEIGD